MWDPSIFFLNINRKLLNFLLIKELESYSHEKDKNDVQFEGFIFDDI